MKEILKRAIERLYDSNLNRLEKMTIMEFLFSLEQGKVMEIGKYAFEDDFKLTHDGLFFKNVLILEAYNKNPLDETIVLKAKDNKFVIHNFREQYDISFFPLYSKEEMLDNYIDRNGKANLYDLIKETKEECQCNCQNNYELGIEDYLEDIEKPLT